MKMTLAVTKLMFLFTTAAALAVSPINSQQCEADHECGSKEYCYKTRFCGKCLDCVSYHRHQVSPHICAKTALDCGECLAGYKDEYLTNRNRKHLCRQEPIPPPTTTQPIDITAASPNWLIIGSVAIMVVVLISLLTAWRACIQKKTVVVFKFLKGLRRGPENVDDPEGQPPPYSASESGQLMPSAPRGLDVDGQSPSASFSMGIEEQAEQCMQKAVPFLKPQDPYHASDNESVEDTDENQIDHHYPPPPDIHDEDTQPSNWTPGNSESLANDSGVSDVGTSPNSSVATPRCGSQVDIGPSSQTMSLNFAGRLANQIAVIRPASPEPARSAKRQRRDSGAQSDDESSDSCSNNNNITNIINNVNINILHKN